MSEKNAPRTLSQGLFPANRAKVKKHFMKYGGAGQGRGATYDNYGYQAELASRLHRDWPNGQKQIYMSQSSLYDSMSNMPGENSSRTSERCKRCLLFFGIILLVSAIVVSIILAIYFSQRDIQVTTKPTVVPTTQTMVSTTRTTIPVPKAVVKKYDVDLTTVGNFTPALNDSTSTEYKEKEESVKKTMDAIYMNSSLADRYNGTEVLGFSQGSIIVNLRVYFIIIITPPSPTPAARNMTDPPPVGNTTQTIKTTTTQQPDLIIDIIIKQVKENAVRLKLVTTKNSIQIREITTTVRPTTAPIRTTKTPILTTKTTAPPPPPTSLATKEITKTTRPLTEQPTIPYTESSKTSETKKDLTTLEPQPPILTTVAATTHAHNEFTPPDSSTIESASQITTAHHTTTHARESTTPSKTTNPPASSTIESASQITTTPHTRTEPASKATTAHAATTYAPESTTPSNQFTRPVSSTIEPTSQATIPTSSTSRNVTYPFTMSTHAQKSTNVTALVITTEEWETRYTGTTMTPNTTQPGNCNPGLISCKSGQCIRRDWFCDKYIDCLDASDEDDNRCHRNTTQPPVVNPKSTGNDLNCNFDNHTKQLCNYKTSPGVYNWSVAQGPTNSNNTGPDFDHTSMKSKGRFLFTESSYGNYNDNATVTSIIVTTDNISHSLTFYYHMYGAHMGSLEVYFNIFTSKGLQRDLKWRESGNHGNMWLKACISMPKETKLSVEFVAYRGLNYTSDIAIDDIKYSTDSCTSISCSYEHSNCGHLINLTTPNSYKWQRVRGEEMMSKQGPPKTDFTLGKKYGAFLIADSINGKVNDRAIFHTPLIRTLKETTLNIRLYISGSNVGHLRLNLLSHPDLLSNYTTQISSLTQGWKRICEPIPKGFVGFAEFVAVRGDGTSGFIAVDDVALGPETTCDGFSTCKFKSGIFCNFDVTGKDYRWKHFSSLKGGYLIANGEGTEGSNSKLVSPKFIPLPNSSISFRYAIEGTSILSVWATEYTKAGEDKKKIWTTEGLMTGVQTTSTANIITQANSMTENNSSNMDWLTACIDLPMANNISIEIVSRKIDQNGGKVALDWVNINKKPCEIGLTYSACNFDEPHLCNYEIECPISTQYRWKRNSGSTPTIGTGPPRDHTFNNTIGHYLFTESTVGRPEDKAVVTFIDVQSTMNTSIRFNYYMSGSDIGSLYIIVGGKSDKINWIQEGNKAPFWYFGCVDLPSNKKVNVSFYGIHGNGPLGDIAIDDVRLSHEKCPDSHIVCDFENEMMCGYTGLSTHQTRDEKSFEEQWFRVNGSSIIMPQSDHTFHSSKGHFLVTIHPSKIASPRIPYGLTMCLKFYYFIQMGKGQNIKVVADYVDNKKNIEKLFGTNGFSLARWRQGQMTLIPGNLSIIFSVEHYNQEISSTVFALDDVSINYGKCNATVCDKEMFKCEQDDICIPNYKKCDMVRDCSDGADELNCPTNSSKIRLVDGITSGDQGRLEIYVNGSWGTAYSLRWFESNAKVACRQLGYTGYYKSVRFGKFFFGLGDVWQINCIGNETSLQDCDKVNVVHSISHMYDVGLACYNTICEPGKKVCPKVANSSVVYCLYPSQFCDGDYDCPGGEDEKNCSHCKANEFACKNHKCILKTERCDGKPDCADASDEMHCIRRDVESNVELFYNDIWMPLCDSGSNEAFNSKLCLIMGHGVSKRKTVSSSTAIGLNPTPDSSKMTVIGKYLLSPSSKPCRKMKLECYGQECGSRAQRMFDPYVQFGNQAVPTEYPWQAMLLRNGNFHCGASIFNSRWLITAEHCVVERYVKYEVVVGLLRMQNLNKFPKIKVIEIIHSMNYGSYKGIPINDIALILLEKDIVFTDFIQPVCLPSKVFTADDYCYLSGWGRDENLVSQSHLKETKVYAISSEECKKYYDNITDNSFICFRHNKPNMPSCYGDSGGPLVCRNDRGRFELAGVVSFGLPLCAASNGTPAAFTNVLNFRGWIVDQTRCKMWCPDGKCLYEAETCDGIDHCRDRSDELPPKCTPTVTCNFGKAYKCGYRNDSNNPWYWASPHWSTPYMKSKPMTGGDRETDEYMLASVNATESSPAILISPTTTEIPCISFNYLANANNTAKTVLILKVTTQDFSSYKEIWNHGKNNTHEKMFFWQLATISLPTKTTSLKFEAYYENPDQYSFIAIDNINLMDKNCTVCLSTEFQCNTGRCINRKNVCDRIQHCSDGSDELNCFQSNSPAVCSSDHFQCLNGKCILKDRKCNGIIDCTDGSDEKNCTIDSGHCSWDQFRCTDGQCIEDYLRCDGFWHCSDGSDELNCHQTTVVPSGICKWNQFRCNNGQCIEFHLKCDNIKHCKDGSDEKNCGEKTTVQPGGCTWDQFRCDNGQCIQAFLRCDRLWHCKDGSDERNCPVSTQIPEHQCRSDQVQCRDGYCIQRNWKCDGIWHCVDGSDEESCLSPSTASPGNSFHCRWDQFQCNNGNCIESYLKCDGVNHCKDGSDEQFCYRTTTEIAGRCLLSQFRCNNGQCIEYFLKCDKVEHCKDGSDEQNCGAATNQPQGNCRWDQFHCKNGQCIQYYHRCDHIWHCKDGSDEQNCLKPMIKKTDCNFNEFGCLDGKCIEMILVCNKNKDCSLGEDEHNCTNTTHSISATSTKTKTNIPSISATHPHITKAIIPPGASTIIPLVTAAPIHRGTRINIPLVTAVPVQRRTRIVIPLVTAASIQHGTRINISHVTTPPIQHTTKMNIPFVTVTPIQRGTRINIPLVTAPPIQHSTRIDIPLVTVAPIQHGTRINISLVTVVPIQRGTRINIPLVTTTRIQHGTKINGSFITTASNRHATRFNIPLVTLVPIQRGTRFNISLVTAAPIQHGTRINISHSTTNSILLNKTKFPHRTITSFPPRSAIVPHVTEITTKQSTRINVPSIKIHHRARTSILPVTASHTHHHRRTSPHITVTPSHHDRIKSFPVKHTTIPPHRTSLSLKSTNSVPHETKFTIPYITATSSPFHKTSQSYITATSTTHHHQKISFPPVTTISTDHQTKTIPLHSSTNPLHYHKTSPLYSTTVAHKKRTSVPLVRQTSRKVHPQLTTTTKFTVTPWIHSLVTTRSNQHVTSSVPTLFSTTKKDSACAANEFRCDERQCIPTAFVCDVIPDCDNAKDELSCDDDVTTTVKNTQPTACFPNEFKCDENQCIPKLFVCDIIPDCDNGRDEENCEKPTTTAENLLPKSCQDYQFRCSNGECILKSKRCDQMVDCSDHSDEHNCGNTMKPITEACAANEFRCDERQCIPTAFVCDAIPDCDNGKDEKNCENETTNVKNTHPTACQDYQFRCSNGECILKSKRCDQMVDCSDHSDEHNCVNTITPSQSTTIKPTIKGCTDNQFQCDNGACISISRYCDTFRDCNDGSDEKCSTSTPKSTLKGCSYDDFRCNNGQCIPLSFHCDGLFDCNDRSDEKNCSRSPPTQPSVKGCGVDEFRCRNGHCIQLAFVCDGLLDCPDSSDEQNCPLTTPTQATTTTEFNICTKREYECPSGKCINADYVCDGVPDCPSADDETSCKVSTSSPKTSIPPSDKCFPLEVKECLQVGYSHSLLPNVFGDKSYTAAMERFYMKAMPIVHQKCSKNALMLFCGTIFPLCKNGVSKYTCKSICREVEQSCGKDAILMDTCDWLVDDSRWCFIGLTGNEKFQGNKTTSRTTLHPGGEGCRKGYYQCKNSKICLHPIQLCDGEPTCPQADDEPENCTCLPNQFKCASGQCVMKSRRCNGYQDCKDYSDEHNCSENECVGRLCRSGQCVPSSSFCDGIFDCDDLSDEKLCECRPPHRRCNNQVCITPDKWCNREDNCGDNSDEKNCDCSIGEVMCSDGKCIPMEWWCDGNQDCSDGKDESHCHKKKNSTTTSTSTSTSTTTTTVPTTTTIVFPFKDNCRLDEFICTRGYKCIKRSKVCDMKWDCVDGEDEATCVSLRKEDSVRNTTAILTLTVKGQTSMVCSSKWSMQWASFICKYLRHKNVKKVEFVDPPPGTTSFQQLLRRSLESPGKDFIKTTSTCATNKIVRMTCNERICGTNRHHSIKYQEFIIGGDLARRYTWPWSVSLLYLGEPMCGATLISDRWLVTAAHCIVTGMWNRTKVPHYFSAILGEVDLFKGLMNGTRIAIDKIVFPRDMKLVVFNPDPDIALLRLKYSVEPSHQIEPICMPKLPKHDQGSTCYLAGWGGTHKPGESRRRYSNFLHEVRMIIRNTSDCSTFQPQPNWDHNLCAGYLESTITGCYGDSGGALMCWEPDNHWTLVGVLSKGRYNCAANSPNVFTKISSMRQWIEKSMGWTSEDAV